MSRPSARRLVAVLALAALLMAPTTGMAIPWDEAGAIPPSKTPPAQTPDPLCAQSYANDRPKGGPALHFGIGPRLAGEGGTANTTPLVPENFAKRDQAIRELKGKQYFFVRLNRLFESDGNKGIRTFQKLANRFTRQGVHVELQVRYHPTKADNGNIAKWLAFVRKVVRTFGPNKLVTGLQITNEVNLTYSPNTSDGYWKNSIRALTEGVVTAKAESRRHHYSWQEIGFNFAWRLAKYQVDRDFWAQVARVGGKELRRATDYVGIDLYPGTYTPGILLPGSPPIKNLGDAWLEGIAQLRECWMRHAGFGRTVPIRIDETGYPTGPNRPNEAAQARALSAIVRTAVRYRGTYNVTYFNWFGLRDNNSHGPNFQSFFGLLRDDYSRKPAFGMYRNLIAQYGYRSAVTRRPSSTG
jgi:hypothetical protein